MPRISFAIPVYNGSEAITPTLESLIAQTEPDLEIIVSDNASTDDTEDVVRQVAAGDERVRYCRNDENVGLIENFNLAFRRSNAGFVRWVGCGDKLHETYATRCLDALRDRPDAVGVTTLWAFVETDGRRIEATYNGRRVDSHLALHRLHRFLAFMDMNALYFDPIYSLLRREVVLDAGLLPINVNPDRLLALEIALRGPFVHVEEVLAWREAITPMTEQKIRHLHPSLALPRFSVTSLYLDFARCMIRDHLPPHVLIPALVINAAHYLKKLVRLLMRSSRRMIGRLYRKIPNPRHET